MNKFNYDVFLGYASEDKAFASNLRSLLQRVGFAVWMDETRLVAGTLLDKTLERALYQSCHAVFVITERWLEKEYTWREWEWFWPLRTEERLMIPILKIAIEEDVPEPIRKLTGINWQLAHPDSASHLWQIYTALRGKPYGPPEKWESQGHQLLTTTIPIGHGRLKILDFPADAAPEDLTINDHPWNGLDTDLPPGPVLLKLLGAGYYYKETIFIYEGKVQNTRVNPFSILTGDSEQNLWKGSGRNAHYTIDITWCGSDAGIMARRAGYLLHVEHGYSVLLMGWVYYRDKGDGPITDFATSNSLNHADSDTITAKEIVNILGREVPPIRVNRVRGNADPMNNLPKLIRQPLDVSPSHMILFFPET